MADIPYGRDYPDPGWVDEDGRVHGGNVTLTQAHNVFRRWLGDDYDTDALDAVLATAAVEQLDGDPLWLLLLSGSGNAKTETVQGLDGIGATITSTISSPGALLSASPKRERAKEATGGLLRKLGPRGVLVIKDVTSILSMSGDSRAEVLGALREVYDGRWSRNVGTDGGLTLDWTGRIALVGAVTTAWDKAHSAIAAMGDRFVLIRMDSTTGRQAAGRKAIGNTGSEVAMRSELAEAVAGVLTGMNTEPITVTDAETDVLLAAADLVTLSRTGVEYDYRGDVIDAHAPEMPTRFAKQLAQVVRGSVAIGKDRTEALRLAIRCARDSMPPLRLAIIDYLAEHPNSSTADIRKHIGKPRATVDRQLQALHMLSVLECDEQEITWAGRDTTRWYYQLAEGIDPNTLNPQSVPDLATHTPKPHESRFGNKDDLAIPPAISGTDWGVA
ncbi:iclR helix-turn-helix domain protein [Mycobacterium kansasii]|uniref:IclR helix-turn-helix domain protein n=1 Tax=Mycobacterium kansasii TaxID=1768 RepID=A0A1V3XH63_MYCKA|nr:iclR helix-turn-helix domain protein [Mycobacterium kansasii]